ncbi:unnamed protein product [Rotaria sp. Silwood2]|nr:unnamed protein product [Rotaria sp. Silwood2]
MHSIFRIDQIKQIEHDNDPERFDLTERIPKENLRIDRMTSSSDEGEKAHFYHYFDVIKDGQGDYEMAIYFYEKSLEINREILSPNHHYLSSSYNGIGWAYNAKTGDFSKIFSSHEKALEIFQKNSFFK